MELVELRAEDRNTTGKSKARQLRASGKVPMNLYGHNTDATSLMVDTSEFETVIRGHAGANFIMKLIVPGRDESSVIIKEIQRHPTKDHLIHIDLLSVSMDEKIVTTVPIHTIGDAIGVREGGVLQHGVRGLQIEVLPTELPEVVEVDVIELNIGQSVHAGEVPLPDGVTLVGSPDDVVVSVVEPAKIVEPVLEAEEVEGLEVEEGEEAPEGEAEAKES